MKFAGIDVEAPTIYEAADLDRVFVRARRVTLRLVARRGARARRRGFYALEDGWPYVLVTTTFANRGADPVDADLVDAIRADRSFQTSPEAPSDLFWAYDKDFGQAYGVIAEGHTILGENGRRLLLKYRDTAGKVLVPLAPGASYRLARRVIPAQPLRCSART